MLGEVGRASNNPAFGLRNDLAGLEGGNLPVSLGGEPPCLSHLSQTPLWPICSNLGKGGEGRRFYDSDADTGLRFRPQLPTNIGVEGELQGRVDEQFGLNGKGMGKETRDKDP